MNILHFSDTYFPQLNGVTVAIDNIITESSKNNHVILVAPSYKLTNYKIEGKNSTKYGIRSVPFPIYPGVHASIPNIVKMYNLFRDFKPDIVHIHTPFVLGIMGIILAQIWKVKIVSTYHTLFSTGGTAYLSPKRLIPGQNIHVTSEEGVMSAIIWKLQVIFFNLCNAVIAPTKIVGTTIKKQGITPRIKVLPNGVESKKFPMKKLDKPGKKILHLGRIGFEKAVDTTIRAFALAKKEVPDAELIVAGGGPALSAMKNLVKSLGITNSVTFLGMVDPKDTPKVYRSCDIFTTASPFETQGLVLIEAMLSGLPVVAAAVNAPVDIVKHKGNGYLFKEGDEKTYAKYLVQLLQNPDEIKKLGAAARAYAEQYDSKILTNKLLEFYKKI